MRSALALVTVVAACAVSACHRPDSILLVEVAGDLTLKPAELAVTITAAGRQRLLSIPPGGGAEIQLPASFSIELDRAITGPVTIAVDAFDGNGMLLGHGETTQEHINTGGETVVVVTLASDATTHPDGGADAAEEVSDAGERGVPVDASDDFDTGGP